MVDIKQFQDEIDSMLKDGNKASIQIVECEKISHSQLKVVFFGEFSIREIGIIGRIAERASKFYWERAYGEQLTGGKV